MGDIYEEMRKDYAEKDADSPLTKKLYDTFRQIGIDLGFGNKGGKTISESGTEQLTRLLVQVCEEANTMIEISHTQGLCYDAAHFIARRLDECKPIKLKRRALTEKD